MIKTSRQLKDKIKNLSGGNSRKSQTLIRNYIMERFLERISVSDYKENFILKGGMLVASLTGLDMRATMDIDTTVRAIPLTKQEASKIISEIAEIPLDDGITFKITKVSEIMEEHDYSGIRFMLEAAFDMIRQTIKLDVSTGDVITPAAIAYSYKLMFEERSISIYTYNIETLLAEKLETIISRGAANTRMRDFYDIHIIINQEENNINYIDLQKAFFATAQKRGTDVDLITVKEVLSYIEDDINMKHTWETYVNKNYFVSDCSWSDVISTISKILNTIFNIE